MPPAFNIASRRKRIGFTSPPLVGIEQNPGPRKVSLREKRAKAKDPFTKKKRKKLNDMEKGEIRFALKMNMPIHEISRRLNLDRKTIRLWRERVKEDTEMKRKEGSGRPRILTASQCRHIRLLSLRNRRLTAFDLCADVTNDEGQPAASRWTISRRLNDAGLNARVAVKKPLLSLKNRQARVRWALKHKDWVNQWNKVVWSDESPAQIYQSTGRTFVRRRKGERYKERDISPLCFYIIFSHSHIFMGLYFHQLMSKKSNIALINHIIPCSNRIERSRLTESYATELLEVKVATQDVFMSNFCHF